MRAARYGHVDIVQHLLDVGQANLELTAKEDSGTTALITAVKWNKHKVVKLLIERQVNINFQDKVPSCCFLC